MSSTPGGTPAGSSTVHMFPGQGDLSLSPLLRMRPGASLTRALAEVFAEADAVADEFGVAPIGPRLLHGRPTTTRALAEEPAGTVQLALFGVTLAIHRALETDGLRAGRLLAVSFGEIPALTAAECCSVADGARLACYLGQLLTRHGGGMTLLDAGPPQARRLLGHAGPEAAPVVLACVNHAGETVLSGPLSGLSVVEALAAERGVRARRLRLPFMSHHPALAREAGAFAHYARRLRLSAPRRPVFSVVAGRTYDADSDLPRALSACLVRPFSLPAVVGAGLLRGSLAVEAGTGGALANAVRRIDPDRKTLAPFPDGLWQEAGRSPAPAAFPGGGPLQELPHPAPPLTDRNDPYEARAARGHPDAREEETVSPLRQGPAADLLTRLSLLLPQDRASGLVRLLADDRSRRPSTAVRDTGAHQRLTRLAARLPSAADVVADAELLAALGEATALADPSLYQTFLSHYILCVGSITLLGGAAEDLAGGLAHARTKGSFMVTEIGDAASHLRIRTEARFDPGRRAFILRTPDDRAAKFSSVAATGLPQQAVVCARLLTAHGDGGVFSFLTDITGADGRLVPGVSVSGPVAIDALPLPYGFVRFENVEVPYGRWLADGASIDAAGVLHDPRGGPDTRLQRTLGCGQALWATLPSAMAGLAGRSAAMAWRFSATRRSHGRLAPGRPVLDYSTQRHAVVGALASAFTLRCAAAAALSEWAALRDRDEPDGPVGAMTFSPWAAVDRALALRKVFSTRAVATTVDSLQHRCGVSGFFGDNRLSEYLGLARAFDNAGGDNTLILLDTGRALAEEGARSGRLHPSPPADLPAPTDAGWWPAVVAALQDRLTGELALSWSLRHRAGLRDLALWNPLLEDALRVGEVHACRLAADAASAAVTGGAPSWAVPGAADLTALDGLSQAARLSGPLLSSGILTPEDVRALPKAVDTLCDRLSPALADIAAALDPGAAIAPGALDESDYAAGLLARFGADASARPGRTP